LHAKRKKQAAAAPAVKARRSRVTNGEPLRVQVLAWLRQQGAGSPKEIGHAIKADPAYVSQACGRLLGMGAVTRQSRGQYAPDAEFEGTGL
jgi:DNA-binding MarR family transcriptional regulator